MAGIPQPKSSDAGAPAESGNGGLFYTLLLAVVLTAVPLAALLGLRLIQRRAEPLVDLSPSASVMTEPSSDPANSLRFAVATMWGAESTFTLYRQMATHIAAAVGRRETFVVRPSYAKLREMMEAGEVDVALICTGPYVRTLPSGKIKLLVVPVFEDGLEYRSEILVRRDSGVAEVDGLRGRRIAYSDR